MQAGTAWLAPARPDILHHCALSAAIGRFGHAQGVARTGRVRHSSGTPDPTDQPHPPQGAGPPLWEPPPLNQGPAGAGSGPYLPSA